MDSIAKKLPKPARPSKRRSGQSTESVKRFGRSNDGRSGKGGPRSDKPKRTKRNRKVAFSTALLSSLLLRDLGTENDVSGEFLTSDMLLRRVEAFQLRRSFLKKYKEATSSEASKRAIALFLQRNDACARWTPSASEFADDIVDGEFERILYRCVHPSFDSSFGLADIRREISVGSGFNVKVEEADFLTKVFHSSLTRTSQDLYVYYTHAIRGSTWGAAETKRSLRYGHKVVVGGRLSTVSKNVDIARTIDPQPTLNMLFQKGIGAALEDMLKHEFGIDLSIQPEINRELARRGSLTDETDRKGSFCTIDLVGASDSVAVRLCKEKLPAVLFNWLMLARSPYTVLPSGETVQLHMIATMGNGFCFPLQTLLFASIVKACYVALGLKTTRCDHTEAFGLKKVYMPEFGVFGDDIIVRREAYGLVVRTLARYGFVVNDEKSFSSGPFRESCGGDFWYGNLVRGVYIQHLRQESDVYSAINRLVRWSARSGNRLDATLGYLASGVRSKFYVPFISEDTCGIKMPRQHSEPIGVSESGLEIFNHLKAVARSYAAPNEPVLSFPGDWAVGEGTPRNYNGDALLTAFLGGFIRNGRVGLRESEDSLVAYKVRRSIVPFWDYMPKAETSQFRGGSWQAAAAHAKSVIGA